MRTSLSLSLKGYCYSTGGVIAGLRSHDPILDRVCSPAFEAISDHANSMRTCMPEKNHIHVNEYLHTFRVLSLRS